MAHKLPCSKLRPFSCTQAAFCDQVERPNISRFPSFANPLLTPHALHVSRMMLCRNEGCLTGLLPYPEQLNPSHATHKQFSPPCPETSKKFGNASTGSASRNTLY